MHRAAGLVLMVSVSLGCRAAAPERPDGPERDLPLGRDGHSVDRPARDARPPDLLASSDGAAPASTVMTDRGPVQGVLAARWRAFYGIPYAAAPTGSLRWMPPAPAKPWTQPLDASKYGPSCPQLPSALAKLLGGQSEDCLTLNVFTPVPVPTTPAPVMVWIHGGGFVVGGAATEYYDGRPLAETTGAIIVTINYRLGPLGFLAHESLGPSSGNYGILDQQAALAWVKGNIASFGGDPANVTIFGQSAGASSVCVHLVSPASTGLFHRAIMESGTCIGNKISHATAAAQGQDLAQKVGCDGAADKAACLRSIGADTLISALPLKAAVLFGSGVSWGPHVDGVTIPQAPSALFQQGAINKVPVLLGSNQNEGTLFIIAADLLLLTVPQYWALAALVFGANASSVLSLYPAAGYPTPAAAAADLFGDAAFVCSTRSTARAISAAGLPTFLYSFTRVPGSLSVPFLGCFHGAEVPFVFHSAPAGTQLTPEEASLSARIMGYWTRLARSGNPNAAGEVEWPAYVTATDQHLGLDLAISVGSGLKKSKCDFWETVSGL